MRGLIFRCSKFKFQDTARSTLGSDAEKLLEPLRGESYTDALLVLVCIETGDGEREVRNARDRVLQLNRRNPGAKVILIAPFAHLSPDLERPLRSKRLCDRLVRTLEERGFRTEAITFGTHKKFLMEALGSPQAVSYFEYMPRGRRIGQVPRNMSGKYREAQESDAEAAPQCSAT